MATGRWQLASRQPLLLTAVVVAGRPGYAALTAAARMEPQSNGGAESADVGVTVGRDHASTHFG
ncbi:hypothetical protein F0L68_27880 [Solihabitans fulvus]|uniref:Uncharacterized protein n=1 Tax=Solihabitans fulvus TaxID=1892852 RepID=A0A5B2WZT9_9PSEU|nr:hypothetical protein [Solihabitans fulvus]KAA2255999.1 hypothetical protein F0L68_27880 [Solihabitans fulvus]